MAILNYRANRNHFSLSAIDVTAMLKHACKYGWSILKQLVYQENYQPAKWANRLLWLSYCIASFILVIGIFTDLMSTDLVAFIKPPELHLLEDLLTPHFEPMSAIVLTNLPSYGLIKQSEPGT